jgi:TonB family protein
MGYQALLFCPDEKTARTVTQVLSELDFTIVPCTEPFAAVKKLMGEHFDAIVVDCDNEQNATLLFKSAHNTPHNQSSLAVAVVEGQAGVAKAFRIGANLVLTKPINVEQAKGTLRVARGLLRKNDAGKLATPAASTPVKPAAPLPAPPKPVLQRPTPTVAVARPAAPPKPSVMAATASIPTPKPVQQPRVIASAPPPQIADNDAEILEVNDEIVSPSSAEPGAEIAIIEPEVPARTQSVGHSASPAGFGSSSASAPAPAREKKPSVSSGDKAPAVISEPASAVEKVAASGSGSPAGSSSADSSSVQGTAVAASAFTFGGNVSGSAGSTGGRSKKVLLAVLAIVLIAAAGYEAWMQWGISSGTIDAPRHVAPRLVIPAAALKVTPSTVPAVPSSGQPSSAPSSSAPSPAASPVQSTTPDSGPSPTESVKTDSDSDTEDAPSAAKAPAHPTKTSPKAGKPSGSAGAANKTPAPKAAAQPIMIKNGSSQAAAKPVETADAPAPVVIAGAGNGATLPDLGSDSKAATPVLQTLTISQGVSQGLLLKKVQPVYPAASLRLRTEGTVELLATISKNGNISAVKILKGDPQLARAAAEAVKQWKYKPYLLNGEPVEIQTQVSVTFKLPN